MSQSFSVKGELPVGEKMLMAGIKHSIIAEKFQVNKCVIKEISRDKNWKNIKVEDWDEWVNGKRMRL